MPQRVDGRRVTRELAASIGREVMLARTNLGLTPTSAARLAGVAPRTQRRVEGGDSTVGVGTMCRVAAAVGLKVWARAFPAGTPSLRDTGQLTIARHLMGLASPSLRIAIEHGMGNGRAIDLVAFGPTEIVAVEIERLLVDFQAQYRSADAKRAELASAHSRPVRLVLVVEDTRHNRSAAAAHALIIRATLPAGTRDVWRGLREGKELGRDGMAWIRRTRVSPTNT